jgi:hypothetical protein
VPSRAENLFLAWAICVYELPKPVTRIINVVIGGYEKGPGRVLNSGNDLFVGSEVVAAADLYSVPLQAADVFRQRWEILFGDPEINVIRQHALREQTC